MFRNLRFYKIENLWPDSEEALSTALEQAAFEPCGPFTERSSGFMPVAPDASDALARRVSGADLIRLRSQSRVLPAGVINEELETRIAEFRERAKEEPSPRDKRRMKSEAKDELMPKAMLKSDKIWGYVDLKEKVLGIDAALPSANERFLRRLSAGVAGAQFMPLTFKKPVEDLLTRILLGNSPANFAIGRECRMQDTGDAKSKVRWTDFDLHDNAIRNLIADGLKLTHLAVVYDNVLSFVLDENGVITKLRVLGMNDDDTEFDSALQRMDAEFVLTSGLLRHFLGDMKKQLDGYA